MWSGAGLSLRDKLCIVGGRARELGLSKPVRDQKTTSKLLLLLVLNARPSLGSFLASYFNLN